MCEVKPLCQNEVSNIGKHFGKKNLHVKQIYPIKSYSFWHKEEKNFVLPFLQKTQKTFRTQKQAVTISRIRASRNKKNVFQLSLFLIT